MTLRTPLCDLLGIEVPVLQSGMNRIAGPDLVAQVCEAGGLGILAALGLAPDTLRGQIRQVRALTRRPFGVNLWLVEPGNALPGDDALRGAQKQLDVFRSRLGAPAKSALPAVPPLNVPQNIEVILEERVPVFSTALGDPGAEIVSRCHSRGVKVVSMVASIDEALQVERSGVDAVVAQGFEAGGHRSSWTGSEPVGLFALVPRVVDAIKAPVIASGGIGDGRGFAAALALGAQGVLLGTRFLATRESAAPEFWKKAVQAGRESSLTKVLTGLPARAMRNAFVREYEASGAPVLPPFMQRAAAQDVYDAATARGDGELAALFAGQSAGLIHDLPGAGEVVRALAAEAEAALRRAMSATGSR
ncbi:MAG TPA: nitronate monooxygenase [Myxococcales bacterium]